jgi:hypothetical protein
MELNKLSCLFSHKDLGDSSFQDIIIKVLCLEKSLFNLIKESHGLIEDDAIIEYMIPNTFNEDTEFLSHKRLNRV